jgi:formate hydrogenlyase subunit 3/multisubunit Na+/H+ antiporter MnhD subunit
LRFNTIISHTMLTASFASPLFLLFGLLSIGMVIPFLFKQHDLKRLLAYSSVEHMGVIVLAVGIGGDLGRAAVALHLFNHALAKSLLFCVAGEATERYHTRQMTKMRGMIQSAPLLGTLLFIGALAITGVPPLNMFNSELLVIAAFARQMPLMAYALPVLLALVFASIIPHIVQMEFGQGRGNILHVQVEAEHPQHVLPHAAHSLAEEEHTEKCAHRGIVGSPCQRPGLAEKVALWIMVVPALAVLLLGLWLPSAMQGWLHVIGAVLH